VTNQLLAFGWNEDGHLGSDAVKFGEDARVEQADVAFVEVIGIKSRDKIGGEDLISIGLLNAEIGRFAFKVGGGQLGNVFGDSIGGRITFAEQGAAGMIDESAEGQGADIIDPLNRRLGIDDDVFAIFIVKISVVHIKHSSDVFL